MSSRPRKKTVIRVDPLVPYIQDQFDWSIATFGPGKRTKGILAHIRKELFEIASDPTDLTEWIDLMTLAINGYMRHGGKPQELLPRLIAKHTINTQRSWPTGKSEDEPIEHIR